MMLNAFKNAFSTVRRAVWRFLGGYVYIWSLLKELDYQAVEDEYRLQVDRIRVHGRGWDEATLRAEFEKANQLRVALDEAHARAVAARRQFDAISRKAA